MFNPFVRFTLPMIEGFRKLERPYLVSQTYPRGNATIGTLHRESILLSDYADKSMAMLHKKALMNDQYAAILNLNHAQHVHKLQEMLQPGSRYLLFANMIANQKQVDLKANAHYRECVQRYIRTHTNWRIPKEALVLPKLTVIFGEWFVVLKWGKQQLQVRLDDIEKS